MGGFVLRGNNIDQIKDLAWFADCISCTNVSYFHNYNKFIRFCKDQAARNTVFLVGVFLDILSERLLIWRIPIKYRTYSLFCNNLQQKSKHIFVSFARLLLLPWLAAILCFCSSQKSLILPFVCWRYRFCLRLSRLRAVHNFAAHCNSYVQLMLAVKPNEALQPPFLHENWDSWCNILSSLRCRVGTVNWLHRQLSVFLLFR